MILPKNSILVRVDPDQKREAEIGGRLLLSGKEYSDNWREKCPVIAELMQDAEMFQGETVIRGTFLICSYTHFDEESYYFLRDDLYAIPINELIFATINEDGSLKAVNGNVFVEREYTERAIEIHEDYKRPLYNRGIIASDSGEFKKGQEIFWLEMADYEMIYTWKGVEMKAIKVEKSEIVGFIRK